MEKVETYGQLLDLLIVHYEDVLSNMDKYREDEKKLHTYLTSTHTGYGICRCAHYKFGFFIYRSEFINNFSRGNIYLCEVPIDFCNLYYYMKTLLQIRIDRMRAVYEKWKDVQFDDKVGIKVLF